jgi:lipid II:glycine glycyltransferase (peptidoglycan interpeptide bridge formation enzyme)
LQQTYAYEPIVYTTTLPGSEVENGIVFCRIRSWLTGRRLVSVPFSDHCEPLISSPDELEVLVSSLTQELEKRKWKYIELRPCRTFGTSMIGFEQSKNFYFHSLDLNPPLEELFHNFHKGCLQRKIRRAEREGLTYEEGRSQALLNAFYHLLLLTRRRHELPPQPLAWFRNLMHCMGEKAKIRVCYKNSQPVAAIITLTSRNSMVYKYGSSDARFHNLGGMPYLFWKAIQDAKQSGVLQLDLGRCDCENDGLAAFKEHLGGKRSMMTYWTCPAVPSSGGAQGWKVRLSKRLFRWMPNTLRGVTGKVLYKHMG